MELKVQTISLHIVPCNDEEYLITEEAQFFVTAVGTTIFPDGNDCGCYRIEIQKKIRIISEETS